MIKSEIIDFIIQTTPDNINSRGLVSRAFESAINTVFFKVFQQNPYYVNDYLKPYSLLPVKHNDQISIITLPIETLQFPDVADCIRITNQTDTEMMFVPVRMNEIGLIGEIQEIDSVIPFEIKGNKIWLYGLSRVDNLLVECIPAFHELADTDSFKLPSGSDVDVFQSVKEILGIAPPRPIMTYRSANQ